MIGDGLLVLFVGFIEEVIDPTLIVGPKREEIIVTEVAFRRKNRMQRIDTRAANRRGGQALGYTGVVRTLS